MSHKNSQRDQHGSGDRGKKSSYFRGNLIETPSSTSFEARSKAAKASPIASKLQPGRNTIDPPTPSNNSTRRISATYTPGKMSTVSQASSAQLMAHFTGGVPMSNALQKGKSPFSSGSLVLNGSGSSFENKTPQYPQFRNGKQRVEDDSRSSRSSRVTRSKSHQDANEAPIEILDSDEEEAFEQEAGPSNLLPQQSIHRRFEEESLKVRPLHDRSPESGDSNTTLSDGREESTQYNKQPNDVGLDDNLPSMIERKRRGNDAAEADTRSDSASMSPPIERESTQRRSLDLRTGDGRLNPGRSDGGVTNSNKAFSISKPNDSDKLQTTMKRSQRMKGKNGQPALAPKQTQSFLPQQISKFKSSLHMQPKMKSFEELQESDLKHEEKEKKSVHVRQVGFVPIGRFGSEVLCTAEFCKPSSLIIRIQKNDGIKGEKKVILDLSDWKNLSTTPESMSPGPAEIRRILSIDIDPESRTSKKLRDFLESYKGMGTVRPNDSFQVILDIDRSHNTMADQRWIQFRETIRNMAEVDLKDLTASQIQMAEESLEKIPNFLKPKVKSSFSMLIDPSLIAKEKGETEENKSPTYTEAEKHVRGEEEELPLPPKRSASPRKNQTQTRLVYPIRGPDCVTILQSDLEKLEEDQFLNDTIIDFGLKYLLEQIREKDAELHSQIFVFSSFFYERFNERKGDRSIGYKSVSRWTKNTDIFQKKYIVVPINENLHWYLAIITNPLFAIPERDRTRNGKGDAEKAQSSSLDDSSHDDKETEKTRLRQSPESGTGEGEGLGVSTDSLFTEGSPQHQNDCETDGDGDSQMKDSLRIPVEDRRGEVVSDAIKNVGGGKMVGGGENSASSKRKFHGTPIIVGESFAAKQQDDDEEGFVVQQTKRGRSSVLTRSSMRQLSLSPETSKLNRSKQSSPIPPAGFYSSNRLGSMSPQNTRQLRSSGLANPMEYVELDNSRRNSISSQEITSDKWRKQLKESSTICIFDSLQQKHAAVRTAMKHYLAYEYADKRKDQFLDQGSKIDYKEVELNLIDVAMIRQPNYCDCGLYLLHAFERFFSNPEKFKSEVIPSRDSKHPDWNAKEALKLRSYWKEIIEQLSEEWQIERERRLKERQKEKRGQEEEKDDEEELEELKGLDLQEAHE